METTFNVVFSGELQAGADPEDVIQKMSAASSLSEEKFREILEAGRAVIFKKGLTRDEAEKFQKKFSSLGLEMVVREISAQQKPAPSAAEESATPAPEEPATEGIKKNKEQQDTGPSIQIPQTEKEGNPYAAPSADLAVEKSSGGTFLEQPRKLSAGRGWVWLLDGFRLFAAAPWKWLGISVVVLLVLTALQLIPFIGPLVSSVLGVVVAGGLMIGAHSLCGGGDLSFSHIFRGFTENRNQLLLVGCYAMLLGVLSILLLIIPFGASMGLALLGGGDPEVIASALEQGGLFIALFGLIYLALSIPITMAFWFAPGLVAVGGFQSIAALKLSFKGCLRNILPFLVYGLVALVAGFVFAMFFGLVVGAIGFMSNSQGGIMVLIVSVLVSIGIGVPVVAASGLSIYTSFRDIFFEPSSS